MNKLSNSDRESLVRFASTLPKGDPNRRAILAGLKKDSAPGNEIFRDMNRRLGDVEDWASGQARKLEEAGDAKGLEALSSIDAYAVAMAGRVKREVDPALRRVTQSSGEEEVAVLRALQKWYRENDVTGRLEDVDFHATQRRGGGHGGVTTIDAKDAMGRYYSVVGGRAFDMAAIESLLEKRKLIGGLQHGTWRFRIGK